ncbi:MULTISPECIES: hypothetical protein [Carnobacterium]|uniref:hypothetical protein n=1 Tax=Carnobacterium TaxID=2747 RepID=UPI0010724CAC|nr:MULTISPECIES: hypothetical protein [Carnobacterium]MDT1939416.1 hypothetical protein [Carnobacterium divergens]MDT1941854.1 hypothetical protein [Carnobacterium divergens]MDT1947652.1 hypothetical protein [Carnobacterium divergens]MDT1950139.1 hypothetical protein [Carnobacterium divergens]MDT1955317.1 hypothetical protein [Carnobacterium divergens]
MNKEEQLLKDYQQTRQKLEEQEDTIKEFQRKGQRMAEEAYSELRYLLSDISESNDSLNEARVELARLEEDLLVELNQEKKNIVRQQEEAEYQYRKDLQRLKQGD